MSLYKGLEHRVSDRPAGSGRQGSVRATLLLYGGQVEGLWGRGKGCSQSLYPQQLQLHLTQLATGTLEIGRVCTATYI